MANTRIIPILNLHKGSLVKTRKYGKFQYIGDPANTVRIFNELYADELAMVDIGAARQKYQIDFSLLEEIAGEAFMPLAYGGGIKTIDDARRIFRLGYEKIIINSEAIFNPNLIHTLSKEFGSQAIVVSIDYLKLSFLDEIVVTRGRRPSFLRSFSDWIKQVTELGAGEILLSCVNRDGTYSGLDLKTLSVVAENTTIPIIASGGANSEQNFSAAVKCGASAIGVGSMLVYQKQDKGVLINYPEWMRKFQEL